MIFVGGILAHILNKKSKSKSKHNSTGLLLASGLITGEALMGVLVAVAAVSFQGMVPMMGSFAAAGWLGVLVTLAVIYYVYNKVRKN